MSEALGTCPKCGRKTPEDAVICPGCDFILDTSFLGENITDALDEERPGAGGLTPEEQEVSSYGDPIILGALDDGELNSFEGMVSGFTGQQSTQARIYVGGATQALMNPLAVPRLELGLAGEQSLKVTPFERHLLEYVDGRANIEAIRSRCGLEETDFLTALALLADKGFVRMAGTSFEEDDGPSFDDDDDLFEESLDERTALSMAPPAGTFDSEPPGDIVDNDDVFASSADGPPPSLVDEPAEDDSHFDQPFAFADSIASVEREPDFTEVPAAHETSARRRRRRSPSAKPPLPGGAEEETGHDEAARFEGVSSDVFSSPPSMIENVHAIDTDLGSRAANTPLPDDAESFDGNGLDDSSFEDDGLEDDGLEDDGFEDDGFEDDGFEDDGDFDVATADILSMNTQPPVGKDSTGEPSLGGPVRMDAEDISLASLDGAPVSDDLLPLPGGDEWPSVSVAEPSPLPGASLEEAPLPSYLDVDDDDQLSIVDDEPAAPLPSMPNAVAPIPSIESPPSMPSAAPAPSAVSEPVAPPVAADGSVVVNHDMRRKADKLFENALKDHGAGKLSSAIMNAKIAMIHNPGFTECRSALDAWQAQASGKTHTKGNRERALVDEAQRLEQRGDYQGAIRLLDQALEISPNQAAIHNMKGVILATRLRFYREASECLYRAVELAPGNMTYKNNYSKVIVKEEAFGSRDDGKPKKKRLFGGEKQDEKIVIKKLRPKVF